MAYLSFTQVAALVSLHNKSTCSAMTVVSLIYKESRFNPGAATTDPKSTATGLMQTTRTAVTEVNRVYKTSYKFSDMTTAETNVKLGTQYLAICLKRKATTAAALDYYGTGLGLFDDDLGGCRRTRQTSAAD